MHLYGAYVCLHRTNFFDHDVAHGARMGKKTNFFVFFGSPTKMNGENNHVGWGSVLGLVQGTFTGLELF